MRIKDILSPESMIMDLKAKNKEDAIKEMADLEVATDIVNDEDAFIKSIWDRENESTTGIGGGIAMPHARNKSINKARVLFAKSKDGIDYNSLDGQPVHLFFMITAPAGADNTHLQALAKLSGLLIDPDLVEKLKATKTPEEVIDLFEKAEAKKDEEDKKAAEAKKAKEAAKAEGKNDDDDNKPLIVGVTACINGIAHTYMAQEALIKEGKKRGIEVRIETNGSEGVKDKLTPDEIKRAKGVIIASDKKVDMPRFDGKPLVNRPVVDGINKPGELIDDIMDGKADVYHASASDKSEESSSSTEKPGVWAGIYKNLMNGISHMLPFVIGGGILMAISFIVENYGGGAKTPAFIFLNNAGNLAFAFMVPVLSAYIAESIGDLPALMPGFVGGYMASIANGQFQVNVQAHATSPAGFLGGIAAGFIAGYLMVGLKKLFANLPHSVEGMKPMLFYPILGLLFIAAIMFYIINPIFSGINFAITHFLNSMGTGNLVLLTTILAGMMSIDMGGPFNKAAYVFASGA
ncbi:MAG: PTS transporter subunit EIIA, partial [Lactobacillus sp.]|nr:PTS transporter subunit EIIA [Lactobacillus sp.]